MMSQGERIRGLGGREGGAVGEESEGKGENKKRRWKPAWSGKQCDKLPIVELCGGVVGMSEGGF